MATPDDDDVQHTWPRMLDERLHALEGAIADVGEQVAGLARHGASDVQLEAVREYAQGLAARVVQLERVVAALERRE